MSDPSDELKKIAETCETTAAAIDKEPLKGVLKRIVDAVEVTAASSSNSWIGYHSRVYYHGFRRPPAHDIFTSEWGFTSTFASPVSDDWREVEYEDVQRHILRLAGNPDLAKLDEASTDAAALFTRCRDDVVTVLSVLLDLSHAATVEELRDQANGINLFTAAKIIDVHRPERVMTRDAAALSQGLHPPHHFRFYADVLEKQMRFQALKDLAAIARRAASYVERSRRTRKLSEHRVFIGHGRSAVWKDLRDFLERRLNLQVEEFNSDQAAGKTVTGRIDEMLDRCTFAFLVMTGEDEHADATLHARENVVHETGRAQQKLGSKRAIVLLEEGCTPFSNLQGIVYIAFPRGKIRASFEDIREVLEREQIITP